MLYGKLVSFENEAVIKPTPKVPGHPLHKNKALVGRVKKWGGAGLMEGDFKRGLQKISAATGRPVN